MRKAYSRILILVVLVPGSLAAQGLNDIRGVGMGRSSVAGSRGVNALGINPANLGLEDRLPFTLSLMNFGFRTGSDLISYDIYENYFTGVPDSTGKRVPKFLTDADKNKILSLIPAAGATQAEMELTELAVDIRTERFGGIGFGITEHAGAKFNLPREYFSLLLFGTPVSSLDLSGTAVSAWWWREYNVSYGFRFPITPPFVKDLYAGIGVKLVRGYAIAQTEHYAGSITSSPQLLQANFNFLVDRSGADFLAQDSTGNSKSNFSPFPDPAGTGTGIDLGISSEVITGIRVGMSVTDIGRISWDKNLVQTSASASIVTTDPLSQATQDSLKTAFKGKNGPGTPFTSALPTTFRLGATLESEKLPFLSFLPGKMLLEMDYLQGLNNSMGNVTTPRASLGMEYRIIPLLPLRAGIAVGGGDQFRLAAGFGIDLYGFSFDLATENLGLLFSLKDFNLFSIAAGLRIRL
ncbi:MAG TPA: DUF5723 family protein [Bacteroidota bacterium]|nr:DUF5723 family protein [Bacteroidota bacterium]